MKKTLIIIAFLPLLFAGTTGQNTLPDSTNIDTAMVKRIASRMATEWAEDRAEMIDSLFAKKITGRIDYEARPDGSVYAWIWQYRVIGSDTAFDKTTIKRIR